MIPSALCDEGDEFFMTAPTRSNEHRQAFLLRRMIARVVWMSIKF